MLFLPLGGSGSTAGRAFEDVSFTKDLGGFGANGQEGDRMGCFLQDSAMLLCKSGPQFGAPGALSYQYGGVLSRFAVLWCQLNGRLLG